MKKIDESVLKDKRYVYDIEEHTREIKITVPKVDGSKKKVLFAFLDEEVDK